MCRVTTCALPKAPARLLGAGRWLGTQGLGHCQNAPDGPAHLQGVDVRRRGSCSHSSGGVPILQPLRVLMQLGAVVELDGRGGILPSSACTEILIPA